MQMMLLFHGVVCDLFIHFYFIPFFGGLVSVRDSEKSIRLSFAFHSMYHTTVDQFSLSKSISGAGVAKSEFVRILISNRYTDLNIEQFECFDWKMKRKKKIVLCIVKQQMP